MLAKRDAPYVLLNVLGVAVLLFQRFVIYILSAARDRRALNDTEPLREGAAAAKLRWGPTQRDGYANLHNNIHRGRAGWAPLMLPKHPSQHALSSYLGSSP